MDLDKAITERETYLKQQPDYRKEFQTRIDNKLKNITDPEHRIAVILHMISEQQQLLISTIGEMFKHD